MVAWESWARERVEGVEAGGERGEEWVQRGGDTGELWEKM